MVGKLRIGEIAHHRNGICGAPFYVVRFRDCKNGSMIGVVFEEKGHVAVFNRAMLGEGVIQFGVNSWRGDEYEKALREAIAIFEAKQAEVLGK